MKLHQNIPVKKNAVTLSCFMLVAHVQKRMRCIGKKKHCQHLYETIISQLKSMTIVSVPPYHLFMKYCSEVYSTMFLYDQTKIS